MNNVAKVVLHRMMSTVAASPSSAVAKRLPKPNMNYNARRLMYNHIYIAAGLGFTGSALFATFVAYPLIQKEEEFYRTYDPYADFERMRALGLFQSCPPDEVLAEMEEKKKRKAAKK